MHSKPVLYFKDKEWCIDHLKGEAGSMKSKGKWLVLLIVLFIIGLIINSIHKSPLEIESEQMKQLAVKEIEKELPDLLEYDMRSPYERQYCRVDILGSKDINGKKYIVFKADYSMVAKEVGLPDNPGGYLLGLRKVEKKLGGIRLKDGMEFDAYYNGVGPADCGQYPGGVFYGFCKDPRVSKLILEAENGLKLETAVSDRMILTAVPDGQTAFYPSFFDQDNNEIEQSWGVTVACLSNDQNYFQQFEHMGGQWYPIDAENLSSIGPQEADAIWIYPDLHNDLLSEEKRQNVIDAVDKGIPVFFISMPDLLTIADAFSIETEKEEIAGDLEAVFLYKEGETIKLGLIELDDSVSSPILEKTLEIKYQLDIFDKKDSKEGLESGGNLLDKKGEN